MKDKQTEALKLALEALNRNDYLGWQTNIHVRQAIREALAEQPAQQHIEHCLWARNGNQPCPHVQPAQQEPVAIVRWQDIGHISWRTDVLLPDDTPLYTSPPYEATPLASQRSVKPWVGLTDEEELKLAQDSMGKSRHWLVAQVGAKLREKNA